MSGQGAHSTWIALIADHCSMPPGGRLAIFCHPLPQSVHPLECSEQESECYQVRLTTQPRNGGPGPAPGCPRCPLLSPAVRGGWWGGGQDSKSSSTSRFVTPLKWAWLRTASHPPTASHDGDQLRLSRREDAHPPPALLYRRRAIGIQHACRTAKMYTTLGLNFIFTCISANFTTTGG